MNATILKMLLTSFLLTTLMACQTAQPSQKTEKPKIAKPTLNVIKYQQESGGMCLGKEDTKALGIYILELEENQQ